ncbi:unnamed protein product, partial [Symbiodinium pilosum]
MCGPSVNDGAAAEPVVAADAGLEAATQPAEPVAPTVLEAEAAQESQPLQPGGGALVAAADLVKRRRCDEPKNEGSAGVWKSKTAWWCADCNKVTSRLARAYDGLPDSWASTSEAAKVEFFKRCKAEGQHLSFDRARSPLVDTLTSTVTESEKTSVGGGFQPLLWWAQQGYDVEAVEAYGEQKSHDVFGAVYYVGIEHKSKDKIKDTIHLAAQKVKACQPKKLPGGC